MTRRCRRSARIASASKRSKDSPAPQHMTSVAEAETDDSHNTHANHNNETPSKRPSRVVTQVASSPMTAPTTPSGTAPLKLAMSEMHPSKAHQTMAPPSSGLRNGFTDIDYTKTPMQIQIQNTPSKTPAPSSEFTFRSARLAPACELSSDAQRLKESLQPEAAVIKAQLAIERARERAEEKEAGDRRKIAAAKGKSGRFSAAHLAEFKKMDSIEGHASSFRAAPGRFTPVKASASATATATMPITPLKHGIKRSQSHANLDGPEATRPRTVPPRPLTRSEETMLPPNVTKRVRQHKEDDASTRRPVSRDGSSIPRPKSSGTDSLSTGLSRSQTVSSLMTPTKSSLARSGSLKAPSITLVRSPSQPDLHRVNSFSAKVGTVLARSPSKKGFMKWASSNHSESESGSGSSSSSSTTTVPSRVETPGRFGRIKSILKRQVSVTKPKTGIPHLAAPATLTPTRPSFAGSAFPSVPLTTPGRKHDRHVDFTPETKRASMTQDSPSPVKSAIPRSTTLSKLPALAKFAAGGKGVAAAAATRKSADTGEVTYPDLSAYQVEVDGEDSPSRLHESVPGTFTFRSDHTIQFAGSPSKGFGSAAGQASLRQVRKSVAPRQQQQMPGSFPRASLVSASTSASASASASPNNNSNDKENDAPSASPFLQKNGIPHGMANKKRHRAAADEEDEDADEGVKRGMKKLRRVAEPRLLASPIKKTLGSATPPTPSPLKKKTGLSLSRLQMLAQPKIRK